MRQPRESQQRSHPKTLERAVYFAFAGPLAKRLLPGGGGGQTCPERLFFVAENVLGVQDHVATVDMTVSRLVL